MSSTIRRILCLGVLLATGPWAFAGEAYTVDKDGKVLLPDFPAPAVTLYVAPTGSDTNPGDQSRPFATLEKARDAIRAMKKNGALPNGGVAVKIAGGAYAVTQTFELSGEDSGTAEAPVIYRSEKRAKPVFSGGVRISGFAPVADTAVLARLPEEARDKVSQIDLKPFGVKDLEPLTLGGFSSGRGFVTHPVIELFFNGEPLPMSRYPNAGVLHVADICSPPDISLHGLSGTKTGRIVYEGDRPARWKDEKDAMLYGYWFFDWADSYERIAAIDTEKREIGFAAPYHTYGYRKGARYYAVNLLSEIDMPGEWYLDRENALLYLYPPSDPDKAVVELSVFPKPMLSMNNVSHVRFEGLTWELGSGDALSVKDGARCLFAGCTIRRFGGDGVTIKGGAEHGVVSCDIYAMGRGGTVVSGGDRKTLAPGGHFVANCDIHHLSRIDHTYTPAVVMGGVGNLISHNRMHHINSSAIRLGGNDHTVEFNEVHDALLESDDQGGADMWGDATYRGNLYRYNYWHHLGNWQRTGEELSCGQAGIRLDDAISGTMIYGNVFYRCASGKAGFGGVQIHGGKDNIIDNNVFADCVTAISFSPWDAQRWKDWVSKEVPGIDTALYESRYPALAHLAEDPNTNLVQRNLVWNCGQFLRRDSGKTVLKDNVTTKDDACFANAKQGNFAMKQCKTGITPPNFKPIPFKAIGLYKDPFRRVLPAKEIRAARER